MERAILNTFLAILYALIFTAVLLFSYSYRDELSIVILMPLFVTIFIAVLMYRDKIQNLENTVGSLQKKVEELKNEINKGNK